MENGTNVSGLRRRFFTLDQVFAMRTFTWTDEDDADDAMETDEAAVFMEFPNVARRVFTYFIDD
jgi:hypothetical protein